MDCDQFKYRYSDVDCPSSNLLISCYNGDFRAFLNYYAKSLKNNHPICHQPCFKALCEGFKLVHTRQDRYKFIDHFVSELQWKEIYNALIIAAYNGAPWSFIETVALKNFSARPLNDYRPIWETEKYILYAAARAGNNAELAENLSNALGVDNTTASSSKSSESPELLRLVNKYIFNQHNNDVLKLLLPWMSCQFLEQHGIALCEAAAHMNSLSTLILLVKEIREKTDTFKIVPVTSLVCHGNMFANMCKSRSLHALHYYLVELSECCEVVPQYDKAYFLEQIPVGLAKLFEDDEPVGLSQLELVFTPLRAFIEKEFLGFVINFG